MFISRHHDDSIVDYLEINKTRKFITYKYYWPTLEANMEICMNRYDIFLTLKTVRYKPYEVL